MWLERHSPKASIAATLTRHPCTETQQREQYIEQGTRTYLSRECTDVDDVNVSVSCAVS
jgi:hypothetical protein